MRKGNNIVLTVAYDGTNYYGFQSQAGTGLITIQESIEKGIRKLTGEVVSIEGSGRTDTGVHAWGQVVNFFSESTIPPERWKLALPPYLPEDIVIRDSWGADAEFHSRYMAIEKTYVYQFYCDRIPNPFYQRYSFHVPYKLNVEAMAQAGAYLVGKHNFRSFCSAAARNKSFVREIYACTLVQEGPLLKLIIRGNGFLWNMVRIIAGNLLSVGSGRRKPEYMLELLACDDRKKGAATLPARGLFLQEVVY